MSSILEEEFYEKKIEFIAARNKVCQYRFYKMIQERKKYVPLLSERFDDPATFDDVESKLFSTVNIYINCLRGEFESEEIPDYLKTQYKIYNPSELTISNSTTGADYYLFQSWNISASG